jgi:hypothetical protein
VVPAVKVGLYTAIYGESDWPKPVPDLGVPAVMFTDSDRTAEQAVTAGWEVKMVRHYITTLRGDPKIVAPMLAHKYWKCHPDVAFPGYYASLWIDGSMEILCQNYVELCLEALGEDDWSCVPHPARNCIYPEAEYSATLHWKYDPPSILAQAEFYRQFHPPGTGLQATGANVRRHTSEVLELGRLWWKEILNWSHQDQVSLPVLFRLMDGKVKYNHNLPWFQWWHLHEHGGR